MTCRTKSRHAADHDERPGTAAKRVCRRLLTIQQAADVDPVPVAQILHWIISGELPVYRLAGGLRIDEVELAEFLSTRQFNQP